MNKSEKEFYEEQTTKGYDVLRNGWPDFLLIPLDGSKPFAVELKYGDDELSPAQKKMHRALKQAGIKVRLHQVTADLSDKVKRVTQKKPAKRPARRSLATTSKGKKKTWIEIIIDVLDQQADKLSTGELESIIKGRYHVRLKGVRNLHGTIGSALANIRKGVHPRVRCKQRPDGTFIYWTIRRPK